MSNPFISMIEAFSFSFAPRGWALCAGQTLFGRGQEPPHRLRPAAFDGVAAIVQSVFVDDAEIELRLGIAAFGGLKQMLHHTRRSLTSGETARRRERAAHLLFL